MILYLSYLFTKHFEYIFISCLLEMSAISSYFVHIIILTTSIILYLFLGSFIASFTYPLSHDYVSTPHPTSPHSPPEAATISSKLIETYKKEGTIVLRNLVPDNIIKLLQSGVRDIDRNKTLHCSMAYFNGPPILHRYTTLCQWPERIHDHFRDALYHSPLSHAASQLMDHSAVRVMNTIVMGSDPHNTIPKLRGEEWKFLFYFEYCFAEMAFRLWNLHRTWRLYKWTDYVAPSDGNLQTRL